MKKLVWIAALFFFGMASAGAESLEGALEETLEGLPLDFWQASYENAFPAGESFREFLLRLSRGEAALDGEALLQALGQKFLGAVSSSLGRMAGLLIPAVFFGVLDRLRGSFSHEALGEVLHSGCFLLLAVLLAGDLQMYMALAGENITRMADLMQGLFPLLLTLLAAVGATAGAAFFQQAIVAACGTMTALVRSWTLPLALAGGLTTLLDRLSPRMHVKRLSLLFQSAAKWLLGVGFTVFLSVTALQALGTAAVDGVSLRTAKYAVDHFVPVVGGMFADTMDTLVGASLLIKNSLGITGLLLLMVTAAGPLLQTLAAALLYRCAAALLEPVAQPRFSGCMQDFSGVLMLLFVIQLTVGAMFLLLVAQMLVVGNLTVMLR